MGIPPNYDPPIDVLNIPCGNNYHIFLNSCKKCQCGQNDLDKPVESPRPMEPWPGGITPYEPLTQLSGWLCPACGKGNSPFINQCPCPGNVKTFTSDGTQQAFGTLNIK